jgi:hypothetical protein
VTQTHSEKPKKSLEQTLADAVNAARELDIQSPRADAVKLAVQTLLLIRGGMNPELFSKQGRTFNPYPALVKYIRASNTETLGALADDVLRNISPEFITLRSLGLPAEEIYRSDVLGQEAMALLKEETTPLIMLMKRLYQEARGFDEADTASGESSKSKGVS